MGSWELSGNQTNWQGYVFQLLNQTNTESSGFTEPFSVKAAHGLHRLYLSTAKRFKDIILIQGGLTFILVPPQGLTYEVNLGTDFIYFFEEFFFF